MVRAVDDDNEADFLRIICLYPTYATGMLANYATYYRDTRFVMQWVLYDDNGHAHIAAELYQQTLTVCCDNEDTDSEVFAAFLAIVPEWRTIVAPKCFVQSLPERVKSGKKFTYGSVLLLPPQSLTVFPPPHEGIVRQPDCEQIFKLLCECNEDFKQRANHDFWYADLTYRLRHNTAQLFAIKQNGIYAAAANAVYLTGGALISNVCTLPEYRGRGLARAVTSALSHTLINEGLTPHLLSVSPEADKLYESVGFSKISQWASIINS